MGALTTLAFSHSQSLAFSHSQSHKGFCLVCRYARSLLIKHAQLPITSTRARATLSCALTLWRAPFAGLVLSGAWIKYINANAPKLAEVGILPVQALIMTILAVACVLVAIKTYIHNCIVQTGA